MKRTLRELFQNPGTMTMVAGICMLGLLPGAAWAKVEIELIDISSPPMTPVQLAAFEEAAGKWEDTLNDSIKVKLNVGFQNLPNGVLGQTIPVMVTHNYGTVLSAFGGVNAQIPSSTVMSLPVSSLPVTDIGGDRQATKITMPRANARALGLGTTPDGQWGGSLPNDADAQVVFANAFAGQFDFDQSDGIPPGMTDFIAVAAHEIGHALGFVSLTDVQDNNPNLTLGPSPLDIWRFAETGGTHLLDTENRLLTAAPAEFFDTTLNNIPFSWGVNENDPNCGCCAGGCQASHWRDNLHEQLMDPTLAAGESKNVHVHDTHAMYRVGWDKNDIFAYQPRKYWPIKKCILDWICPGCPPDIPAGWPEWDDQPIIPDFEPNTGFSIAAEIHDSEQGRTIPRTLVGTALFAEERANPHKAMQGLPPVEGAFQLFPTRERSASLPPALLDFYLVSDSQNGPRFTARAAFPEGGTAFDPSLGRLGGYRITLEVDSEADGMVGDVDALMTLELLATESDPEPWLPRPGNAFQIDPVVADNALSLIDPLAFGFCQLPAEKETESNDTASSADTLGATGYTHVLGQIGSAGDVDYFRFYAPSNSKAWITVDTGGPQYAGANSRDSVLTLLEPDGLSVVERDDNDGTGNGSDSSIESVDASAIAGATLRRAGRYYAQVQAAAADQVIKPYRMLLTVTRGPAQNETEPNDTSEQANPIVSSHNHVGVRSGRFAHGHDVDYFSVELAAPSLLHVSADGDPERNGSNPDVKAELIGPDGETVLLSANSSGTGEGGENWPAEGFCYRAKTAGTYYVRVLPVDGTIGTYDLMVAACRIAPPEITVTRERSSLLVSWPAEAEGCRLQASDDMTSWKDVDERPELVEDRMEVRLPMEAQSLFFRLICED